MFRLNTLPKVLHIGLSYFVDLWVGGGKAREKSFFKYKHLIAFLFLSLFCPFSLSLSLSLSLNSWWLLLFQTVFDGKTILCEYQWGSLRQLKQMENVMLDGQMKMESFLQTIF